VTKTRVASVGGAPKSKIEIIHDRAIKEHAKHPELIEEIERRTWEFQKRELSGEVLDLHAALEQFRAEIGRVGAPSPLPPKDPGPKPGSSVKRWVASSPKATVSARKGKPPARGKRQTPKKRIHGK
jgi:hypothetical protein